MMYLVWVIVCHVGMSTGCQGVKEATHQEYGTYEACQTAARTLIEGLKQASDEEVQQLPTKPWTVQGYCLIPVIDETYLG